MTSSSRPAADPLTGGKYQYVDKTAKAGVTYYYRLEEVERTGSTNTFGPISVPRAGWNGGTCWCCFCWGAGSLHCGFLAESVLLPRERAHKIA